MQRSTLVRGGFVVGACALVGAIGGIAGSAAAPSGKSQTQTTANGHKGWGPGRGGHPGFARGGPAVHGELVVPNKDGNGFVTVTMDSGKVKSLSGDQLTITEGTDKATYKDATLTIPTDATVRRNFADAKLSDVKEGDRVHVAQSSEGTFVFAVDDAHQDQRPGPGWGHGPGGPGPYGGPPPPGGP
jgi:hypothetical protein